MYVCYFLCIFYNKYKNSAEQLKHSDLLFSNTLHQFTMSLDQAVKTVYATKTECAS